MGFDPIPQCGVPGFVRSLPSTPHYHRLPCVLESYPRQKSMQSFYPSQDSHVGWTEAKDHLQGSTREREGPSVRILPHKSFHQFMVVYPAAKIRMVGIMLPGLSNVGRICISKNHKSLIG